MCYYLKKKVFEKKCVLSNELYSLVIDIFLFTFLLYIFITITNITGLQVKLDVVNA